MGNIARPAVEFIQGAVSVGALAVGADTSPWIIVVTIRCMRLGGIRRHARCTMDVMHPCVFVLSS